MLKRKIELTQKQYEELVRVYNKGFIFIAKDHSGCHRNANRLTWVFTKLPRRLEKTKEWDKGIRKYRSNRLRGEPVGCDSIRATVDFLTWEDGPEYIAEILKRSQYGLPSRKRDWLANYTEVCEEMGIEPYLPKPKEESK